MNNPRNIIAIKPGATYEVPMYSVTNEGLTDGPTAFIEFCKGNKQDETAFRQTGLFTETLIQTSKEYLESVNVGELASPATTEAIKKLEEALMWLGKRASDRQLRGVQGTYQK